MGMDPEFVLMKDNGEIVFASEFMEHGGSVGSDAVRFGVRLFTPLPSSGRYRERIRRR